MPTQNEEPKQSWEERLEELNKRLGLGTVGLFEVKQFISQEIQKATIEADRKAREEEREKCIRWTINNKDACREEDWGTLTFGEYIIKKYKEQNK